LLLKRFIVNRILFYLLLSAVIQACNPKSGEQSEALAENDSSLTKNSTRLMTPTLNEYIESIKQNIDSIPEERKTLLNEIANYIAERREKNVPAQLTFICTHNSRRSHLCQVWAATAGSYYNFNGELKTFSGGTESTAFNPRAVAALERAGFLIENPGGDNPEYRVKFGESSEAMVCFSKTYDDPVNPSNNFAAIMTCSEADENCPFIPGADLRVPIPYTDPKESDGTAIETQAYDERCFQIATEMFYIFEQLS
jgi:arsenate reductase